MKKKKMMMMGGAAALVVALLVGGAFAWKMRQAKTKTQTEQPAAKKRKSVSVNVIPVAERPYVLITPNDSRNVSITLNETHKETDKFEYELEYQAGSLQQGAFGELAIGGLPLTQKILLGSCSAGGACRYHEDVKGGTLLLRFEGPEPYAVKSDWKYIAPTSETVFASRDAKFQLTSSALKRSVIIIYNSPGYPQGLTGTPVSEIYTLQGETPLGGTGKLSIRANEEGSFKIMGWNGSSWKSFETSMNGKEATATVELMQAYVVVK